MADGEDNKSFDQAKDETSDNIELDKLSDHKEEEKNHDHIKDSKGDKGTEADSPNNAVPTDTPPPDGDRPDTEKLLHNTTISTPKSKTRLKTPITKPRPKVIPVTPREEVKEAKWDRSPYTYKMRGGRRHSWLERATSARTQASPDIALELNGDTLTTSGNNIDLLDIVAPIGHFGDFYSPEEMGQLAYGSDSDTEDEGLQHPGGYFEDPVLLNEDNTIFGLLKSQISPGVVDVTNKMDRKQLLNGLKLADRIGTVPLSKAWHLFSEFFAIAVFIANVVVGIYDIIRAAQHLYYKVSAVVFGVLENIILIIMWFIARHPKLKQREDYKTILKRMQYAENITAEIFMYITIVISLFGFATEKMYQTPSDAFGWAQLILLILDLFAILYTNVVRMYMLYKLMKDILAVVYPENDTPGGYMNGKSSFAGYLMPRTHLTIVGNLCLLLVIGGMLGVQVWKDNYTSEDYHATLQSALLLILLILIPILGNILFPLINLYWVMELFTSLNVAVGNDTECMKKLGDEYGDTVAGTLEFAQTRFSQNQNKLLDVENTKNWQKLLHGLTEISVLCLIFFYTVMTFLAVYFFNGFSQNWLNVFIKCLFFALLLIADGHLLLLMVLSNFAIVVFLVSALVYPLSVPCFCRKKNNVMDGFQRMRNKLL